MAQTLTAATHPLARWAQRAPIAVYLAGTFAWAWLLWGYWIPTMPPTGLVVTPAFVLTAIVGGLGPSLAAIVTSWLIGGRAESGRLLHGITRWRAAPWLYALSLGIVPAATVFKTLLTPVLVGPLAPQDPAIIAIAAIWPILAALGEEFGWRGFLFPRLLTRYSPIFAALILGVIWGVWHLPADYIALKGFGGLFWLAFLLDGPLILTAHALIMAWLWRRSDGNLVLMVLYHWTITATAMLAPTAGGIDTMGLAADVLRDVVFWIIAAGLWLIDLR